jgi:hypothetical protein
MAALFLVNRFFKKSSSRSKLLHRRPVNCVSTSVWRSPGEPGISSLYQAHVALRSMKSCTSLGNERGNDASSSLYPCANAGETIVTTSARLWQARLIGFPFFDQLHYIANVPEPIRDAGGHSRRHANAAVDPEEVIPISGSRRRGASGLGVL